MTSKSAANPSDGRGVFAGLLGFVKTTLVGGAVFLVPVTIFALLLAKVGGVLLRVAQPLAKRLPLDTAAGSSISPAPRTPAQARSW
jgi:hypothetical protein